MEDHIYEEGKGRRTEKQKTTLTSKEAYNEATGGLVWEYIKIYHDSQYAMKLRSLLDSFRLEDDSNGDKGKSIGDTTPPIRYRVLKATRLVLVDETGEAILLA